MSEPRFFATAPKGVEELVATELRALGAPQVEVGRGGAYFGGGLEAAYKACLWLRTANRVLLPIRSFSAPTPEKLYAGIKSVRWSSHMTPDQTLVVDFSSNRSAITHTHYGALKVKDAIVDQFQSVQGRRPSVDRDRPDIRVNVYLNENEAIVSLDLSGESLHERGYRSRETAAPLKENLAAAILQLAEWPEISARGGAFVDPMCGSGTLPIEAGLVASRMAPGLLRKRFGFMKWLGHDQALWKKLVNEAVEQEVEDPKCCVYGYDQDFRVVSKAIENVGEAGLTGRVHVEKRELSLCEAPASRAAAPKGIVVVNPPYGERLGVTSELESLYERIGDTFKQRFQGWVGYVFTGNPDLAKKIGLKASRRFVLFNGPIECRLLRFELY